MSDSDSRFIATNPSPRGLCMCGCGQPAGTVKETDRRRGVIKGQPCRFLRGHYNRVRFQHTPPDARGYRTREHKRVAAKALGRRLPHGANVHHVNDNRADNRPGNLVICEDAAYHRLLHLRRDALRACGHAEWRRCTGCERYCDVGELEPLNRSGPQRGLIHGGCRKAYRRMWNNRMRDARRARESAASSPTRSHEAGGTRRELVAAGSHA